MAANMKNQYAPPKSTVADVADRADAFEKAGRGVRLGAFLLDSLISGIWLAPAYFAAFAALARMPRGQNPLALWGALAATGWLFTLGVLGSLAMLVITAVLVYRNGQTIAKKLLGIKVVRTDGSKATLSRIFWLRNVVNSLITVIPFIGALYVFADFLWIFGEQRRCLHDYIADTIVIRA